MPRNNSVAPLVNIKRRKSIKSKVTIPNKIPRIWKDFCDATSIVGLRFIGGRKPTNGFRRFLWLLIWITMFGLCSWQCANIIQTYLKSNVKTSTTFQTVSSINFPAITICNQNIFRRSVVGGSAELMIALATFFARNASEVSLMIKENSQTCQTVNKTSKATKMDEIGVATLLTKLGFEEGMRRIGVDSFSSVVKCWWLNEEANCSEMFFNHFTDYSFCFTFNPSGKIISTETNHSVNQNLGLIPGYGINLKGYKEKILSKPGVRSGLRLILNADQTEYCGAGRKWTGAGFLVQVHDPALVPAFSYQKSLLISPGFDYDVALRQTLINRKTEDMGLCASAVKLYMYPDAEVYYQSECVLQCLTEVIWKKCDCVPFVYAADKNAVASKLGVSGDKLDICWGTGMMCVKEAFEYFLGLTITKTCPLCRQPCVEKRYDYGVSSLKFQSAHTRNWSISQLGSDRDIEKNLLSVNFYFEDSSLLVIEESRAFTLLNAFMYFGARLGLYLGMSVVTVYEICHYLLLTVDSLIRRPKRRRPNRMYGRPRNSLFNDLLLGSSPNTTWRVKNKWRIFVSKIRLAGPTAKTNNKLRVIMPIVVQKSRSCSHKN